MFNFFNKHKTPRWEKALLTNIFKLLGDSFEADAFSEQLELGLLHKSIPHLHSNPYYVTFVIDQRIYNMFEKKQDPYYMLNGIEVWDTISNDYLLCSIHVLAGVILGYSIGTDKKFHLDVSNVRVQDVYKKLAPIDDYLEIEALLTPEEKELINPSIVRRMELNNEVFYRILDMGDENAVAIDLQKNVYNIYLSIYSIKPLKRSLIHILEKK